MRHALCIPTLVLGGFDLALAADPTRPPKPPGALLGWLRAGVYRETGPDHFRRITIADGIVTWCVSAKFPLFTARPIRAREST